MAGGSTAIDIGTLIVRSAEIHVGRPRRDCGRVRAPQSCAGSLVGQSQAPQVRRRPLGSREHGPERLPPKGIMPMVE
jgi:hypothetical protein